MMTNNPHGMVNNFMQKPSPQPPMTNGKALDFPFKCMCSSEMITIEALL